MGEIAKRDEIKEERELERDLEIVDVERKRKGITSMTGSERADMAYEAFTKYVKGKSYTAIGRELNLTQSATRTLVEEYSRIVQIHRPAAKVAGEENYRAIMSAAWGALSGDEKLSPKAQNFPKVLEVLIQAQTRLDKYYGLEIAQPQVSVSAESIADLIRREEERIYEHGHVEDADVVTMEEHIDERADTPGEPEDGGEKQPF